jgi:hypothetical protein
MTDRTIVDTCADAEIEANGFSDSDVLLELRNLISELLTEYTDAKETGNDGCGCGSADIEFDMDGIVFTVSISLSGDEEIEH